MSDDNSEEEMLRQEIADLKQKLVISEETRERNLQDNMLQRRDFRLSAKTSMNNGGPIPIRIINTSPKRVTIKDGSTLGYAEDLQESDLESSRLQCENVSHGLNQACSDRSDIEKVLSKW
ncbi:hypothetical protein DPMN_004189 [Dreissena polymorpha]|nr:hypothetical protein DPMN_004189 [Dreissena polymorpha]